MRTLGWQAITRGVLGCALVGLVPLAAVGCDSDGSGGGDGGEGGNGDGVGGSSAASGDGGSGPGGCSGAELSCGGTCIDPNSDALHCGACDSPCDDGLSCLNGRCSSVAQPEELCTPPIQPVDTSSPDHVVGTGTPESCTFEALETAVAAGGIITFDCGGPVTIDVTSALQLSITVDTVIDGGGVVTLDGARDTGRQTRIFEMRGTDYRVNTTRAVLQGLTLQNAAAPTGDFTPQDASQPECAWGYKDGEGGAVFVRDGILHVIDCVFSGNRAASPGPDTGGGAIYALGARELVVVGSSFIGNEGSNSGAIGLLQTDGVFYNSVFQGNRATGEGQNYGGATGCPTFNHAEQGGAGGNGAAIGIDGDAVDRVDFCGVIIRDNSANELGTVGRTPNTHRGKSTFDRCWFDGNFAGDGGGAIWMMDMEFEMRNSTLSNNESNGLGGGLRVDQGPHGSTLLIENTTFSGNVAHDSLGGGLVFAGQGTVTNCTFAENEAEGGEGIFGAGIVAQGTGWDGLSVNNTIFWNNRSTHQYTPMTCSIDNPGSPGVLPGANNVQWPTNRQDPNGVSEIMDNPCTAGILWEDVQLGPLEVTSGSIPTRAPAAASGAVGGGEDCPIIDQLGNARPASGCTMGAVEVE